MVGKKFLPGPFGSNVRQLGSVRKFPLRKFEIQSWETIYTTSDHILPYHEPLLYCSLGCFDNLLGLGTTILTSIAKLSKPRATLQFYNNTIASLPGVPV